MLAIIEEHLDKLSKAEQRVGRWILAHPRQAAHAAVADVAIGADTSQPTVVRFCRSVGVSGFRELKIRLAESIGRPASYLHRDVDVDDTTADAAGKVLDRSIQSLVDLREAVDSLPIDTCIEHILDARQVLFVGVGSSGHVAADACHKFFRLGIPSVAVSDGPTMLQYAAIAGPAQVFVVVSQSGRSPDVVAAANTARSARATVVAVTDPRAPLARIASLLLALPSPEDASVYTPMSSRLAQLVVLDILQVALALRLGPDAVRNLSRSKQVLYRHRAQGGD